MTEEEKKDLEYIKESPTSREIMLLRIISKLQADIEIKDKVIDLMAEQLTTPVHNKEWVKKYYENEVNTNE